jgi:hypothetical protein
MRWERERERDGAGRVMRKGMGRSRLEKKNAGVVLLSLLSRPEQAPALSFFQTHPRPRRRVVIVQGDVAARGEDLEEGKETGGVRKTERSTLACFILAERGCCAHRLATACDVSFCKEDGVPIEAGATA